MSFLPQDYEVPKSSGNYSKFADGDNKFRILSSPVIGWEDWKEDLGGKKSPIRFRLDNKPTGSIDPKKPFKQFWSMVAWNYAESRIQILHITQKSILYELEKLYRDEDYGDPRKYDLKIVKDKTSGGIVRYSVKPLPPKPVAKEVLEAQAAKPCNLVALFDNEDPWTTPATTAYDQEKDEEEAFRVLLPDDLDLSSLEEYMSHLVSKSKGSFTYEQIRRDAMGRMAQFVSAYQLWMSNHVVSSS